MNDPVRRAARVQLAAGVLDAWVMGGLMWAVCGHVGGWLTEGVGSWGGLLGWASCLLVPFGAVEILWSLTALDRGDPALVRSLARAQVGALAVGGWSSALVGAWVLRTVR